MPKLSRSAQKILSRPLSYGKLPRRLVEDPMRFRPVGRRVLLRREDDAPKQVGDLHVPDKLIQGQAPVLQAAQVLAIGDALRGSGLKPGDRVLISRHADHPTIRLNGEELSVLPFDALQVIL